MKLFYYDLETTGTKFWRNGIHQISGMITIDGEVRERFNFKVQPYHACEVEDEALAIAGVTRNDLLSYEPMQIVYLKIIALLNKYVDKFNKQDKFHLVGYNNASFDNAFFRAFFVQNGDQYFGSWFWSSSIDVMVLAAEVLYHKRHEMKDFKLKTVAAELGIHVDESKLHDAMYDIELTKRIHDILRLNKCYNSMDAFIKGTEDFARIVLNMLDKQKQFFKTKDQAILAECKILEDTAAKAAKIVLHE